MEEGLLWSWEKRSHLIGKGYGFLSFASFEAFQSYCKEIFEIQETSFREYFSCSLRLLSSLNYAHGWYNPFSHLKAETQRSFLFFQRV